MKRWSAARKIIWGRKKGRAISQGLFECEDTYSEENCVKIEEVILAENERIDDLQCEGRLLIQNRDVFCFGIDAVLLANFASVHTGDNVLDLCTGNGVIPILMEAKTKGKHYAGLEIQELSANLALRSVALNHAEDRITIVQGDVTQASQLFPVHDYDVITVNPPYMNEHHGLVNPSSHKAIARHELLCTLEDIVRESAKLLKEKGRFYMVHRPQRLVEIFETCRKYKLEPKRIKMVHPDADKNATMVLLEAVYRGGPQLLVENPLIVYDAQGNYTEQLLQNYR